MEKVCEYFEHCNVAKISGRDCADYENCQTYKFYKKYQKDDYPKELGIGAMYDINLECKLK